MALSTVVKVSCVNNLSDARFCAGMGVDLMGFCLDKRSPHYISPTKFKEITGWITGVKTVGEFEDSTMEEILECMHDYKLNYIQINSAELLKKLPDIEKHIIFKTSLDNAKSLPIHSSIHFYLLSEEKNLLEASELKVLSDLSKQHSILLGFAIDKSNIKSILSKTSIQGIELKGGNEIKPGLKDFDELAEILESLELADE